jgi:DNA polymerase III sliding clamp (beta) subunit (PCNA family)
MTFISFDQKTLLKALQTLSLISSAKATSQIYGMTKVSLDKDNLVSFFAVSETVSGSIKLQAINLENQEEVTEFLIKTDIFYSSIALIGDQIVGLDIDLKKGQMIVQGSKSKHTLRITTDAITTFKLFELDSEKNEAYVSANVDSLLGSLKLANVAVGNPRTVYQSEFLHICMTVKPETKELILASTDRYRVAKLLVKTEFDKKLNKSTEAKNYLISPKNFSFLNFFEVKKEVELVFNQDFLVMKDETAEFSVRYGEGVFPDYDKIIPQSFICNFDIATSDLLGALKQVQFSAKINTDTHSVKIKLSPKNKMMTLLAEAKDGYSSESVIDIIDYEGSEDDWEQSFNIDYLYNYVNVVTESHILWESNPGKPSVLSPKNKKEESLYLVSGLK